MKNSAGNAIQGLVLQLGCADVYLYPGTRRCTYMLLFPICIFRHNITDMSTSTQIGEAHIAAYFSITREERGRNDRGGGHEGESDG